MICVVCVCPPSVHVDKFGGQSKAGAGADRFIISLRVSVGDNLSREGTRT